jgi:hypothetical protein
MKVEIFNLCRMDGSQRTYLGEFYPSNNVQGIDADQSGIYNSPGEGNSISFSFAEGISDNLDIYVDNGDNTAKVEFCVQVGLYHSGMLINFAEVKLTYWVDLITQFTSLTGYTVTQAETFHDASDETITFDGTLQAYFCNPYDFQELVNDGSIKNQGSIMNLCFRVPDGSFEVADINDLVVKNAIADNPSQTIITNSLISSPGYAEKNCYDSDASDTNVCVVSFVLTADFFDYYAMTLTGYGSVLLEFGDAAGSRRLRGNRARALRPSTMGNFTVKAIEIKTEPEVKLKPKDEGINVPITIVAMLGMVFLLMVTVMLCYRRKENARIQRAYRRMEAKKAAKAAAGKDPCGESCMTNGTMDMTTSRQLVALRCTTISENEIYDGAPARHSRRHLSVGALDASPIMGDVDESDNEQRRPLTNNSDVDEEEAAGRRASF